MEHPEVSIIMPVYNGAKFLEKSIGSIILQTFKNWELICVNDSSTDNTLDVLNNLAQTDDRIRVFTKINEKFGNRATKYGIDRALGKYLIYISQDDMLSDDLLEQNMLCIKKFGVQAVVPQMQYYDLSNNTSTGFIIHSGSDVISGKDAFTLSLDWQIHGFVMWEMDLVRKIGWGTDNLNDDEFTSRVLFYNTERVGFSTGVFYYHNHNPNAITAKWSNNQLDYIDTDAKLYNFIQDTISDKTTTLLKIVSNNTKNDLYRAIIMFCNAIKTIEPNEQRKTRKLIEKSFVNHSKIIKYGYLNFKDRSVFCNRYTFRLALLLKSLNSQFNA